MKLIAWFDEISKEDVGLVGGKGANLGEMYNAGFPIPPGFVVTAEAYKLFIEKTGIKEKIFEIIRNLDVENTKQLVSASKKIQAIITSTKIPEEIEQEIRRAYRRLSDKNLERNLLVAVRSSATAEDLPEASFAGQQATFLNVRGEQEVIDAVRKCWASLWTARAIYYREKNNFPHEKVLIAVVVQKQIKSEKSGVMFTANPVTNDTNQIIIEAAWGLGEAIVSGEVNPDLYIVDKRTFQIVSKEINEKELMVIYDPVDRQNKLVHVPEDKKKAQVLTDNEIISLAKIGKRIEEHYGYPQDIEWAIEKGRIYIVQSRNITTLGKRKSGEEHIEAESKEAKILVKGLPASPGIGYGKVKIILGPEDFDKFEKGDVLVTRMTNPDFVPLMSKAAAIVTDEGGMTSHAAIVSRELGVPCIVGTKNATKVLKEGQIVTVDATHGVVYEGKIVLEEEKPKEEKVVTAYSKEITATKILAICDYPEVAKRIRDKVDGIGLLRIEFMIADKGKHPRWYLENGKLDEYTKLLEEGIGEIARIMYPKPVIVRTSDIRTDEYRNLEGGDLEPREANPMMGWHGIRRALDQPEILKAEFRALRNLIKEKGLRNIWVMIPFVISPEEVRMAKELLYEVGLIPHKDIKFGVMVETPAAALIIEDIFEEGVDFISFGTNDLTQLTLGVDRNNEIVAKLFDEMHPAVLKLIERVITIAKEYGVYTSICGQAGSRPDMAEFLVRLGIDSISVNQDAIDYIRETVARIEKKILLEHARKELFNEE